VKQLPELEIAILFEAGTEPSAVQLKAALETFLQGLGGIGGEGWARGFHGG
jgi:hypothetical protein